LVQKQRRRQRLGRSGGRHLAINRVVISEFELRQLEELRNGLDQEFKQRPDNSLGRSRER
jgi:hypothetical protein